MTVSPLGASADTAAVPTAVLFIEDNIPDLQTMLAGVRAGVEVVILDSRLDGIAQIAAHLEGRSGIDVLHIVSHGSAGQASLGSVTLSQASIAGHASTLARIGDALSSGADILLYGCDTGAGADGQALLASLSALTRADIGASSDGTGSALSGGNWALEQASGSIGASSPFNADFAAAYAHLLGSTFGHIPFTTSQSYVSARPGQEGTNWINTGSTASAGYTSFSVFVENNTYPLSYANNLRGRFEYTTGNDEWHLVLVEYASNGAITRTNGGTAAPLNATIRYIDELAGDTMTSYGAHSKYWKSQFDTTTTSGFTLAPDLTPTAIRVNTLDVWGNPGAGAPVAQLGNIDSGDPDGGLYSIDTQSVPGLFAVSGTALVMGSAGALAPGQSATVTLRYGDQFDRNADGSMIPGHGVVRMITITGRENPDGFGPASHVNTTTAQQQNQPAVAHLADGGYVMVWRSANQGLDTGGNGGVYGRMLDAAGSPTGAEFALSDQSANASENLPSVAALEGGGYVVAYAKTGAGDVMFRVAGAGAGNALGAETHLATTTSGVQGAPVLAGLAGGKFAAAWTDAGSTDIKTRVFNADGSAATAELTANLTLAGTQGNPAIGALANGGFVLAWRDPAGNNDLMARVMTANGAGGAEIVVADGNAGQAGVKVAGLAGGGFVAVFQESGNTEDGIADGSSESNIYGRVYDASGVPAGARFLVNTGIAGSQLTPSVSALADGGFTVAWTSNGVADGANDVFARRFDSDGSARDSHDLLVNDGARTNIQNAPSLAGGDAGFLVAWYDTLGDSGGGVMARMFSTANRAPTLAHGIDLVSIDEDVPSADVEDISGDDPPNWGDNVDDLLAASGYADADGDDWAGIAISGNAANPATEGRWQYSTDQGAEFWHDIGAVSPGAALLLIANDNGPTTFLRFVPVADFHGRPGALTVHAVQDSPDLQQFSSWEGATEVRATFDTTADDGTSPVSAAGTSWNVEVTSINDKPVFVNLSAADNQTVAASSAAVAIDVGADARITDVDSADFSGGRVTVALGGRATGDVLAFKAGGPVSLSGGMAAGSVVSVGGVAIGAIGAAGTGAAGQDLVVQFNSGATPSRVSTLVRELSFDTTGNTAGERTVTVTVTDGDGGSVDAATRITVTTNPTVTITSNASALKAGASATISFVFSDAPTGVEAADFTVTGGALGALVQDAQDPKLYTAQFTPAANLEGSASISIGAGKFTDAGGQANEASTVNAAIAVDTIAPAVTVTSSVPTLKAGESATITFTFSEVPAGFAAGDVVATNGALNDFSATANPLVYTATFAPASDTQDVMGQVRVTANSYTDVAGNDGSGGNVGIAGDTLAPTLAISAASTTLKAGEQTTLTFTFSEAPSNFALGDVAVTGGSLGNLSATADPKVYTATFTPSASNALAATVGVAASAYTDAIGNGGAASNILSIVGDTLAPSVTISSDRTVFKAGQGATLTFTFNETPVGFDAADIVASGGTLGALNATGDSKVFTATFMPDAANVLAGGIQVAAGGVTDANGNLNPASNLLTVSGNTLAPVVTDAHLSISGATGSGGAFKAGDTVTASWDNGAAGDGNPDVAGVSFDLSQFGGSATAAGALAGGVWSASYTIAAGSVDATGRNVAVTVTDTGANATTLTDTSNAILDNQAPTVSAGAISLSGATGAGGVFRIGDTMVASWNGDANADIASSDFDFSAFGGSAVAATLNAGVWSASYTIAAGAISAAGLAVSLTATDDAGNSRTQASSATAALDAVRPAVSSITVAGTPGPGVTSIDFTVVFSEAVSGVDLPDFALTTTGQATGTLANISGSGTTWTVTVDSIAGRGTLGLDLKASGTGILDGAGNAIGAGFTGALHASGINAVPVIGSNGGGNTAAIELAEGLTAVTTVLATDADNDALQYSITGGLDATLFGIGADGKLRFLSAPSAATQLDAGHDGVYDVQVTAADAFGGADTQSIAVTVLRDLDGDGIPDIHDDDIDNDGRPNSAEDPVPGAFGTIGDGNGDGIADSRQTNVASLPTAVAGNPFATLEVGANYTLTSVSAGPIPTGLPRNVKLPLGQLDFTIDDVTPGGTVEVAIYVDAAQKVNSYFKLDNSGKWVNIAKSVTTVGSKTKITFDLKDGGPLDSDGVANGRIVDPGGVALVTPLITSNGGTPNAAISLVEGKLAVTTATASLPVTWSLGGADAALFQVDAATGAVSFRAAPSYGQPLDTGGTPHDNVYVLDLIAADANGSDKQTLNVTVQKYVAPPVTPPAPSTVDGVPVVTGTIVNSDGSVSTTISIPVVVSTRPEQVGNNTVADIPLATSNGKQILTAQVPTGFGLQVSSSGVQTPANSLTDLIREIKSHTATGSQDQASLTGGGSGFLAGLPTDAPLLVQTIVPTIASGAAVPGEALVLTGSPSNAGTALTALVIDTSSLPAGATIQLQNVDFAAIIGAATVTGGAGSQKVWGDSAAQTLFLGADDDVLHGGGGDDIVGSAGGNDRIYGDEGNDIVFGGEGDDTIDGGTGTDTIRLMGASRAEYTMRIKDGALVMTHLKLDADGVDTVVNVERLQYAGQAGTADFTDSEIAGLVRLYSTAFGRNADTGGINFWIEAHEKGYSMMEIAHFFIASDEAKASFGALSNRDFVTELYEVAMHRVATAGEVGFWTDHLQHGALDRGEVLYYFATSEEKVDLVGVVNTSIITT